MGPPSFEQDERAAHGHPWSGPDISVQAFDRARWPNTPASHPKGGQSMDDELVSVRYMVDDVDAAIDFYTSRLGFELRQNASPAFAEVTAAGCDCCSRARRVRRAGPCPTDARLSQAAGTGSISSSTTSMRRSNACAPGGAFGSAARSSADRADVRSCLKILRVTPSNSSSPPPRKGGSRRRAVGQAAR